MDVRNIWMEHNAVGLKHKGSFERFEAFVASSGPQPILPYKYGNYRTVSSPDWQFIGRRPQLMSMVFIVGGMEEARSEAFSWPACLAICENRLPSGIPHISLLIEDIPRYACLPDYRENCIKNIQTIGEILPGTARVAYLQSISSNRDARVIVSLEELPVHALYFKDDKGRHLFIWEKFRIFKVFGTLKLKGNEVILIAHKLLKVQDIRGSLNTLSLLSAAVLPMYYQYKELK